MLPPADDHWTLIEAAHLLNRAGFGGSPDEIRSLHALGRYKAVDSLISPTERDEVFPYPAWAQEEQAMADRRERVQQRREMLQSLRGLSSEKAEEKRREFFKMSQREARRQGLEAQGWWFRRMLLSKAPLREKMTLFWHDHFATSIQKVKDSVQLIEQNRLFRDHAFGSFKALTELIVMDPAMMAYLDIQNSRKGQPNENFAREVMELFTLGEGNYTEQDVREAARAFTGYQFTKVTGKPYHNRSQWDDTDKTIFEKTGPFTGADVIQLIFEKPAAARFMTRKIWQFFGDENPTDQLIEALADGFRKADYQMKHLLREIFLSKEFYTTTSIRSQIKSPVQFLIQLLKQMEITEPPLGFPITGQQQLGQILFMPPNVAGWDWGQAWINTNTLLARYNLAGFLTKGAAESSKTMPMERSKTPGMTLAQRNAELRWTGPDYEKIAPRSLRANPAELVDSLIFRFFQSPLPDKARGSFVEYAITKKGAIFTDKETAELCHLMLSTPSYQLC